MIENVVLVIAGNKKEADNFTHWHRHEHKAEVGEIKYTYKHVAYRDVLRGYHGGKTILIAYVGTWDDRQNAALIKAEADMLIARGAREI